MRGFHFESVSLPESAEQLREDVREFLLNNLDADFFPNSDFNSGASAQFSRKLG